MHNIKLRFDTRFQRTFTACICIFKEITLVLADQLYFFENTNACNKRTLKTTVASLFKAELRFQSNYHVLSQPT